jgi:bacterioferritin
MDGDSVRKELNTLLKGERMAVESYEKFIFAVDNEGIKSEFQNIQSRHRQHVEKLAERIRDIGGRPDYNTGITGVIANARLTMETKSMKDSFDILKRAYDGEDRGIAAAEEVITGNLDEESRQLVNNILAQDHEHLKSMLSLMSEYGYTQ